MPVTSEDIALAHRLAARYRNRHRSNAEDDDIISDGLLAVALAVDHWDTHPAVREKTNREAFVSRRVQMGLIEGLRSRHGRSRDGFPRQRFQDRMLRLDSAEKPLSEVVGQDDDALAETLNLTAVELDLLSSREREILVRTTLQGDTLVEVAKSLGISEHRACELRLRALDRLRGDVHDLSAREIEVLTRIAEGDSNAQAGVVLYVSEETIKSHFRHILGKLHARSRAHAVTIGFRSGLLH